ncbi:MAG: helix-turn-helix domain-containing protein [Sulfuritalea sp.]|jgi:transcriptional regulator with XRE-family HTH domain|nr:helix-turn-helix domain-containing protein [Sulfuritalea sp.]
MVAATTPKRKTPAKKRPAAKSVSKRPAPEQAESGLVAQMRAMAGNILDMGATTVGAARTLRTATGIAKALLPDFSEPGVWTRTGAALRRIREAAGLTITEVGTAINLKDPSLIEAWENGRIAVPFELILRLAAVLGRNDPVGFVMKFTRSSNPDLWRSLEGLGVGKLLIQSAREREFANIYRADDEARSLNDEEFAEVLAFTRAAFEMALAFRGRSAKRSK